MYIPTVNKVVGYVRLFNFGRVTDLCEEKLNLKPKLCCSGELVYHSSLIGLSNKCG